MKLNRLSASAALLGIVSLTAAGLKAPTNAAPLGESSGSSELAQRIGERSGDTCRRVRGANVLYTEPDTDSSEIANMLPNEQVNMIRDAFVGDDGGMWFELEDSVGNIGYMPAEARTEPGGPLESTLVDCPGEGTSAFPVTW
ncbi:MAG: SH3 domain-containing protein [Phormidium sp.]|nr:MAG: Bacterial SH3 domain [Phormidium sp. OSCR]